MTTRKPARRIVVGVDGTDLARQAAEWAAREAKLRGLPLVVYNVVEMPVPPNLYARWAPVLDVRDLRPSREAVARAAAERARAVSPDLPVTVEVVEGLGAAVALIDASRDATLVVVGCRGHGPFVSATLGSVSAALASHAHCPVVVVRGADSGIPVTGPVVVGIDGSTTDATVLQHAFDAADRRRVPLEVVHVWSDFPLSGPSPAGLEAEAPWNELEDEARRFVADAVGPWLDKYPAVDARTVILRDRPARALVAEAEGAQLLVVGPRGRGGFSALLVGSVARAMCHHAPCPVLVVRGAARPDLGAGVEA